MVYWRLSMMLPAVNVASPLFMRMRMIGSPGVPENKLSLSIAELTNSQATSLALGFGPCAKPLLLTTRLAGAITASGLLSMVVSASSARWRSAVLDLPCEFVIGCRLMLRSQGSNRRL